ncbi:MAG: amidohydrolase family protein [Lysobacterales bacterium]
MKSTYIAVTRFSLMIFLLSSFSGKAGNDTIFLNSFEGAGVIVACSTPPMPAATGRCDVSAGTQFLLIKADLATPHQLFQNGELLIGTNGEIQCAGCNCSQVDGYAGATTLSCPEVVATPGLINSHDHLTFQSPAVDHGNERFDHRHDWRTGERGHNNITLSPTDRGSDINTLGEIRQLLGGVTSVVGSGSAPGFVRNLDRSIDRDGLTGPDMELDTFPLGDSRGTLIESGCDYPEIPAPRSGQVYYPHVALGIDQAARNEWLCLAQAVENVDPTLPGPSLVNAISLTTQDIPALVETDATVVWSPRSDLSLYGMTTPVSLLAGNGINITLGTNWAATGSNNMLREFSCASQHNESALNGYFSDQEMLAMATRSAAIAAGLGEQIGALQAGLTADVTLFDASVNEGFSAPLKARPQDIVLVLKSGVPLFGDGPVVEGLGFGNDSCELMGSVIAGDCLSEHRLCVTREGSANGFTYANLSPKTAGLAPLYSCDTAPALERSCVPSRNEGDGIVFTGLASANDNDGDGVEDTADNCPQTFNPPRPVDGFVQSDSDNDGAGDFCDSTP